MISLVIEQNNSVIVYNEKNRTTAMKQLSGGKLLGFTSSSFSIKRGSTVYTYDERGRQISAKIGC